MKNKIIFLSLIAILISCSKQNSKVNNNILLGDEVRVSYPVEFGTPNQPSDWMDGINKTQLFERIFDQVINKNTPVYSPNYGLIFVNEKFPNHIVLESMDWTDTIGNLDELKGIYFEEIWFASDDLKKFSKKIDFWGPMRIWNCTKDPGNICKKLIFFAKPTTDSKGELVAKNIFTEFKIFNYVDVFPETTGLDIKKFINTVLDKIKNGNLTAYDPVYMIDKSLKPLSSAEVLKILGGEQMSAQDVKEIESLIFEENWYFDGNSMNIYKEVVSVGFLKRYWGDGETKSKILFFIKFQ